MFIISDHTRVHMPSSDSLVIGMKLKAEKSFASYKNVAWTEVPCLPNFYCCTSLWNKKLWVYYGVIIDFVVFCSAFTLVWDPFYLGRSFNLWRLALYKLYMKLEFVPIENKVCPSIGNVYQLMLLKEVISILYENYMKHILHCMSSIQCFNAVAGGTYCQWFFVMVWNCVTPLSVLTH